MFSSSAPAASAVSSPTNAPRFPRCSVRSPWPAAPWPNATPSPPACANGSAPPSRSNGWTRTTWPRPSALIRRIKPDLVINVALPYQDLPIMDACLETGVDYLDTANYEPPDVAKFEYKWQWAYQERFEQAGLMALLGCGLRSRRDQRLLRLGPEAPLRRDPHHRHHRLQRRRPRPALRHQLQPGDQHPRGHPARPLLGERRVGGDRPAQLVHDLRLPRGHRPEEDAT